MSGTRSCAVRSPKIYRIFRKSKKNIFKYQNKDGILILNYDNDITREFEKEANGEVIFFSSKTKLENGIIYDDEKIKSCENGKEEKVDEKYIDYENRKSGKNYLKQNDKRQIQQL